MSINLQKGQKIDLSKGGAGGTGLHRVMVGLGWDEAPRSGGGLFGLRQPQPIDCDASVILCGANGKIVSTDIKQCCVYFGNLRHYSGAIVHQGDNLTGAGDGDDEQIMVNLPMVPSNHRKDGVRSQHLRCTCTQPALRNDSQCVHSLGRCGHRD